MKDPIRKTIQRTQQYWYVDGLTELAFAGLCLLLGIYFLAESVLPTESLLYQVLDISFVLLIVGGSLLLNRLVKILKERITYPRTGYVSYIQPKPGRRWVLALAAFLLSSGLAGLLSLSTESQTWMPALTGLAIAVVWLYVAYKIGLTRFILLGLTSFILGGAIVLLGVGGIPGLAIFYSTFGVAMLVSGGVTLRSYLQNTALSGEA